MTQEQDEKPISILSDSVPEDNPFDLDEMPIENAEDLSEYSGAFEGDVFPPEMMSATSVFNLQTQDDKASEESFENFQFSQQLDEHTF